MPKNLPEFHGFGLPEVFVILLIAVIIYCFAMMIDAIRRPSSQYAVGSKKVWVAVLVLSNPLICRFFGEFLWTVGTITFLIGSVSYHIVIRRHKDFERTIQASKTDKIYDKEL